MIFKVKNNITVHFIGIGGIGMSGIAEVILKMGYQVTGSDISNSKNVSRLTSLGAKIQIGHSAKNIVDPTIVVFSSAITDDNKEFQEAKRLNIPIMRRAEMLAELMRLKKGIAIAGTHGKTTTTSYLATILKEVGFDPTYIIGGIVHNLEGHAQVGRGEYIIAEADESDGSFLLLNPVLSVITNIDADHLDYYGSEKKLHECFLQFINKVPFYGLCALNAHNDVLLQMIPEIRRPWCLFGIEGVNEEERVDFLAKNISQDQECTSFDLFYKGEFACKIKTKLFGRHNILNALGSITMAYHLGISFEEIAKSIIHFEGVGRRFQTVYKDENIEMIDDYAHHPTAIASTLETLRNRTDRKIVAVFQPHRYTRTQQCWRSFLHCFNQSDEVFLLPIYAASEKKIKGITARSLSRDINKLHPDLTKCIDEVSGLSEYLTLMKEKNEKAVIISIGAGSVGRLTKELVESVFTK